MSVSTVSPRVNTPAVAPQAQAQTQLKTLSSAKASAQGLRPAWSSPAQDGFTSAAARPMSASATGAANTGAANTGAASMIGPMREAAVGGRQLTADEKKTLEGVFGKGLDTSKLRVATAPQALFDKLPRETPAFTVGNTIVVNPKYTLDNAMLVHEAAHAWQFQNGGVDYLPKALVAQNLGQGYDWQKGLASGRSFSSLNPEQQAQMLQDAFTSGYFTSGSFKAGGTDYTAVMDAAMKDVRAGKGASTTWDTTK